MCVARACGVRAVPAGCGSTAGASGADPRDLAQIKTSSEIVEAFVEVEWGRVMAEFDDDNNELLSKEEFIAHFVSFHKRLKARAEPVPLRDRRLPRGCKGCMGCRRSRAPTGHPLHGGRSMDGS